ncbi:MAG: hypothetical protein IKB98_05315 [Clostridia bacterium]|nr:hypothetical protein [Clostridia bacterium]
MKLRDVFKLSFCGLILTAIITILLLEAFNVIETDTVFMGYYNLILGLVLISLFAWENNDHRKQIEEKEKELQNFRIATGDEVIKLQNEKKDLQNLNESLLVENKTLQRKIKNQNISLGIYKKNSKKGGR